MKVLVLGIGNIMFSDEGIGVHLCNLLKSKYKFSSNLGSVDFVDGGTLSNLLSPIIIQYDEVLIIDCIDADDGNVGDVYFFNYEDMPKMVNWSGSAHEIEMLQTLQMLEISGDRPNTHILGIIPKRIEPMSFELSDEIQNGAKLIEEQAIKYLKNLGFTCEKVGNFDVNYIADKLKKGQYDLEI